MVKSIGSDVPRGKSGPDTFVGALAELSYVLTHALRRMYRNHLNEDFTGSCTCTDTVRAIGRAGQVLDSSWVMLRSSAVADGVPGQYATALSIGCLGRMACRG